MNSPAETLTPIVESGGFNLVEEDDVAFSISLCREIHRIYGSYQSGELEATDSVHIGLALSTQMLSTLAHSVSKGMPAMRIEVAWAQTSEMMAVMFGEPIVRKTSRTSRQQLQKACPHPSAALRPPASAKAIPLVALQPDSEPPEMPHRMDDSLKEPDSTNTAADSPGRKAESQHGNGRRWDRCRQWMAALPWWSQMLLGTFGCVLAAVVIDAPIVALLLFPDVTVQLSTVYACTAFVAWWTRRRITARSGGEDPVPSRNPLSWESWNGKASPTCTAP
jgi:hypothetical protein